jgi:hypothetical protein
VAIKESIFQKEVDLCKAFIAALPKEWAAYPETGGFDILLVRAADGFQIGIEAKLKLNAKVIVQAAENTRYWNVTDSGPDCRAVLVPAYGSTDLASICRLLGISVIWMEVTKHAWRPFRPHLPTAKSLYDDDDWHECCPHRRIKLPDWIPDVEAGDSAPVMLTPWKVGAIKLAVVLEKKGHLTRADFKHFQTSMSRWTQGEWIVQNGSGGWIKGKYFPDFRKQHPTNYGQIEADYDKWSPPSAAVPKISLEDLHG